MLLAVFGSKIAWLLGCLAAWYIGWLVVCLVAWLVSWLVVSGCRLLFLSLSLLLLSVSFIVIVIFVAVVVANENGRCPSVAHGIVIVAHATSC